MQKHRTTRHKFRSNGSHFLFGGFPPLQLFILLFSPIAQRKATPTKIADGVKFGQVKLRSQDFYDSNKVPFSPVKNVRPWKKILVLTENSGEPEKRKTREKKTLTIESGKF